MWATILAVLASAVLVAGQTPNYFGLPPQQVQSQLEHPKYTIHCSALSEDVCKLAKACSFCRSRGNQGICFEAVAVNHLPADVYPCRYLPQPVLPNTVCDNLPKDQCVGSSGCSWCQSAAVGSACYTETDAAKLPSAVFSCTAAYGAAAFAPAALAPVAAAAQQAAQVPAPGFAPLSTNPVARPTTDSSAAAHPVQHISITQTQTQNEVLG